MIKLMDKVVDRQHRDVGTWIELEEEDRRVRIEVTLQCDELWKIGIAELNDFQDFSFTPIQGRYFQFKLPTFAPEPTNPKSPVDSARFGLEQFCIDKFLSTGSIGLQARRYALEQRRTELWPAIRHSARKESRKLLRNRRGTGPVGTFVAYEEMNKKIREALVHLTRREEKAWRRSESERGSRS